MGVFWLAENMRWGPLIGCELDSASFPWFLWMACRMSLNPSPILPLLSPLIGLSACVHFCEVNVHVWWEWKLYVLWVRVCVTISRGGGSGVLACREVFPPSRLHPTPLVSLHVKASPDPSPSLSPAEHAGCRDPVLWSWVLSNTRYLLEFDSWLIVRWNWTSHLCKTETSQSSGQSQCVAKSSLITYASHSSYRCVKKFAYSGLFLRTTFTETWIHLGIIERVKWGKGA